jgi:hypothetical protein
MPEGKRVRLLEEIEPEQLRKATDEIAALIADRLPLMFSPGDDWPPIAHGFLARAGTLLEALTVLVERGMGGEAQMLLRIVYEHVTTFCWLAIDPEPHILKWREWANARQRKVHNDAKRFGITVLSAAEVAQYESAKSPPPLAQLAEQVDRYWSEHSTAFRPYDDSGDDPPSILTFSGFYVSVYRKASNLIHADMASPDRFASMPLLGHATIHPVEKHSESNDYPAFAAAMVGFLLIVFGDRFDWPDREVVDGITNGLMYHDD